MSDKIPGIVECGNPDCDHKLTVKAYMGYPDDDVPPEKVIEKSTSTPMFSVCCPTCGFYTRFEPLR